MYYDRRLPDDLFALLELQGGLRWLVDHVRDAAPDSGLHVEFRRDRGNRKHGAIQAYAGRTSLLEIRGRSGHRVELGAANTYASLAPDLFGRTIEHAALPALSGRLCEHLARAEAEAPRMFLDGEAVAHAGLMRRYGISCRDGDPFVATDSEARVGFDSEPDRRLFDAEVRGKLGLRCGEDLPKKLDTVGITAEGDVALVELKAPKGDLARAVTQVAAHAVVFKQLMAQPAYSLGDTLVGVVEQKQKVGLVPGGTLPALRHKPDLVPIVAAPDHRDDWLDLWRREVSGVPDQVAALVPDLRFWRLSFTGEILEDVAA